MAVVANRVEVAQGDDGELVAVQRALVIDPESGVAQEMERVLVANEEGDVAVAERTRTVVPQVPSEPHQPPIAVPRSAPPSRPPRRSYNRPVNAHTPLIQANTARPRPKPSKIQLSGCLLCSLVYLCTGILLIVLGVVYVWPCDPLRVAAVSIAAFGVISVLVGFTCCCFTRMTRENRAILIFIAISILLGLALIAVVNESFYGLIDEQNFFKNHSHIDGCNKYDENAALPVSLVVISYVLFVMMLFYFIGAGLNVITRKKRRPFLYK